MLNSGLKEHLCSYASYAQQGVELGATSTTEYPGTSCISVEYMYTPCSHKTLELRVFKHNLKYLEMVYVLFQKVEHLEHLACPLQIFTFS